jgi:hypothetical protein
MRTFEDMPPIISRQVSQASDRDVLMSLQFVDKGRCIIPILKKKLASSNVD